MPSYYYSSLLQYSDRTVQNMGSDLFPLHHLLRSDPQGSAPIFALKGSKIGPPSQNQAPLPYFLRSKQPKKPVLVDVAFVMKKLAEKVVFPVFFFLLSFFFSAPFFTQTCPNLFCAPTKSRSSFFPSVLFCGCLILSSRRSRLRKGVDYWGWMFSTWSAKFCAVGECCSNDELGLAL